LQLGVTGLEPGDITNGEHSNLRDPANQSAAESGAVGAQNSDIEADLQRVVDAWPQLTDADRRRILDIIRAEADASETPTCVSTIKPTVERRSSQKGTARGAMT